MRRKAKTMVPPLQQADFDALPYSVQRKYFSSLERLQIRQQSLDDYAGAGSSGPSSRASSTAHLRPSLTLSCQRQYRSAQDPLRCDDFSSVDIEFFLSLPEKVRKLYFSRDEQQLLLIDCERAGLGQTQHHDFERVRQRFSDFRFGFPKGEDDDNSYTRGRSRRRSLSPGSRVSSSRASSRSAIEEKDSDVQSSLFYVDNMSPPRRVQRRIQPSDMRRTMSLSGTPRHYSTSSAMLFGAPSALMMADAPLFAMQPNMRHHRAHSSASTSAPSANTPTTPIFDPEATHYQDPEARKKLRMYLASPQKFDEAIEFGFPSTAEHTAVKPHYQLPPIASHSRKFSRDMQTFLKDGKLSFFEDNGSVNQGLDSDEEASVPDEVESPVTPSSTGMSFRLHSRHVSHSKASSDGVTPTIVPSGGNLNREMTLRMTLTRPDLRADDDQLYGWQTTTQSTPRASKDDPLALEDLVLTDDMTGTKGPFYVKPKPKGNLVTRMLKRASLRAR